MVTVSQVKKTLAIYAKAWMTQNPDLFLTIFTNDVTYAERAFEKPYTSHKEIRQYWVEKVVKEQLNITFKLLQVYVDGDTAIAEWEATFDYHKPAEQGRLRLKELAVLTFNGDKLSALREYWQSEKP